MTTFEEKQFFKYLTDIMSLMDQPNDLDRNNVVREKLFLAGTTLYQSKYILDTSFKSSIEYLQYVQKEIEHTT